MWLKPKSGSALVCPSDKVKRSELLSKCKKEFEDNGCASCAQGDGFCGPNAASAIAGKCKCHYYPTDGCPSPNWQNTYEEFYHFHQHSTEPVWQNFTRTDYWDCDALESDMDEQQCSWSSLCFLDVHHFIMIAYVIDIKCKRITNLTIHVISGIRHGFLSSSRMSRRRNSGQ